MSRVRSAVLRAIARTTAREQILIAAYTGEGGQMSQRADKVQALVDAVTALDAAGTAYALIGGVAVGLHTGVPRATLDTDLAVHTRHRGVELTQRLVDAGFELRGEYEHSVNFRHVGGEPLQLAFDRAFDAMIDRAEVFAIDGVPVRVVTKADLIEMKRRAGSDPERRRSKALRDQADVELLLGDIADLDEGW